MDVEDKNLIGYWTDPGKRYGLLNQDRFLKISNNNNDYAFGVFDGHSKYGEVAADTCKHWFENYFNNNLFGHNIRSKQEICDEILKMFKQAHKAILESYKNLTTIRIRKANYRLVEREGKQFYQNKKLKMTYLQEFGTTAVVAWLKKIMGKVHLLIANTGDSIAFIGRDVNGALQPIEGFIVIHSVEKSEDEWKRVEKLGMTRTGGPYIAPPEDSGISEYEIAMTRALGHRYLEEYGLIPDPNISVGYTLQEGDKYLVVCSDGISDVFSPQEILDLIYEYSETMNLKEIASKIVAEAILTWGRKFPDPGDDLAKIADNSTIIIVNLENIINSTSQVNDIEHGE